MKISDLIYEAPISDIVTHGDMDKAGTFRDDDLKKFRDPKWHVKVRNLFSRNPYDIKLYLINGFDKDHVRVNYFNGEEDSLYVGLNDLTYGGLHDEEFARFVLPDLPNEWQQSINVILFQNEGAGRVGMTPWMVAHRMVHAIMITDTHRDISKLIKPATEKFVILMNDMLYEVRSIYSILPTIDKHMSLPLFVHEMAKDIAMFRSGRTDNLSNASEFFVELFAQYITSGKVEFRRGGNTSERVNSRLDPVLDKYEAEWTELFEQIMPILVGKFVVL